MKYRIRTAVPEDERRIRALFIEMLQTIYHTQNVQGYEPGCLNRYWIKGEERIFVAEDEDIVAYLSVEVHHDPEADYIYLDDLSVTERYRNRGIGSALIHEAEAYAWKIGIQNILFHVEKSNTSAFRLYERLGYIVFRNDGSRYLMKKQMGSGSEKSSFPQGRKDMNYLEEYYSNYDEEGRLLSRHGQVEYLTTMRYINECLAGISDPDILEVGAGTGRYSATLAKQGLRVTAVELIEHNLEILRSKLDGTEPITTLLGNALDLSLLPDNSFDLTLLLGPMYHLYTKEEKLKALSEAIRVTKPGRHILVAYCMNDPTVVQYVFGLNHLREVMDLHMLTSDWHCISEPKDLFELVRTEDIAELDAAVPVRRIKLVATDGASHYYKELIDAMDDETFGKWMDYHFTICERQDLIGASHHTLDILQKM